MPGEDGSKLGTNFALRHGCKAVPTEPRPVPRWKTKRREGDGRRLAGTGVRDHPFEEASPNAAI
jgi:hypothetical protein